MEPGLNYLYVKIRKDFGQQVRFCEVPAVMLDSIDPNKLDQKQYCLRNPTSNESQTVIKLSEHYVNTKKIVLRDQGVNHVEGGWPKDINFQDEEATSRHRRRFERDDSYVSAILNSYDGLKHLIEQNNAIEMYNMYFKEINSEEPVEKYFVRKSIVFNDPDERPIASIGWTHEDDSKIVVAYCNKNYPVNRPVNKNATCSIWAIENSAETYTDFIPPSFCWKVACSPSNSSEIIGGLQNGSVCIFDIRAKKEPIAISPIHLAHRDPVTALLYIHSRLNNEFFSGSSDGQCMWWDIRNISRPTDNLVMSIHAPSSPDDGLKYTEGISALQFDRTFTTKFLCGTDTGYVINVNRKGKNHAEVMSAIFSAHKGSVKSVERNPFIPKFFITCGDWTTNIWSDDIQSSPIIFGTSHPKQISDVAWCPQRVSSYMSICRDGIFRYWDLLRKYYEPIVVLPVSKYPLLYIRPNEEGKFVAIGDTKGSLNLITLSDNMVYSGDRDRNLIVQHFDREARKEHILETRVREIRLKLKLEAHVPVDSTLGKVDDETLIHNAEDEYRKVVGEEFKQFETVPTTRGKSLKTVKH
ncbi:dynein intermediate chain 3, ciliary-like [Vanessa tameamea]|uniref:Dynein intermediate chain 3, ciliary-like n=1 Tax=Vanessa tameamea TaxID=334116 RepID=A0A8B8HUE6_VANTA|nr:dynein intermediate chain 3, ciliary-like [Vanessa tameamea]